jgi:RNA polymerase primary sigma factor
LKEITDESLLTASEECALAEAIARGDTNAKSRMIQSNLRLVVKIARDYTGRGMVLEDLIGEGNLGLIRATEEFQPRFGTRFSTYASYWIKQSIRHALINTTSTIRLPAHMISLLTKWRRAERTLGRDLGRAPSFNEVASSLGLTEAQKSLVAKACQARQLKLESSISTENCPRSATGSTDPYPSPDSLMEAADERRLLYAQMERLETRERTVLALRYGLEGESPLTLKEIGRRLNLTREWVRKIELRAIRKLHGVYDRRKGTLSSQSIASGATLKSWSTGSADVKTSATVPTQRCAKVGPRPRANASARPIQRTEQTARAFATAF